MSTTETPRERASHRTTVRLYAQGLRLLLWLQEETNGSITEIVESGIASYADLIEGRMKRKERRQQPEARQRGGADDSQASE